MEKLGNILVRSGQISTDRLEEALVKSMAVGRRIGWVLVEEGLITEEHLASALARQLDMTMIDLDNTPISLDAIKLLPRRVAINYGVFPVRVEGRLLTIAAADPTNVTIDDIVRAITGYDVRTMVAVPSTLARYLEKYYPPPSEEQQVLQERTVGVPPTVPPVEPLPEPNELETIAAVGRMIQSTLGEAIRRSSRGIYGPFPLPDIERNVVMGDKNTVIQVSIVPNLYGERIEVTVSDRQRHLTQLDALGLTSQDARLVRSFLVHPQGLILVVGPQGNGKTTTLYTVLHELRRTAGRIVTVEEPIAHPLEGIHQLPADSKVGISLADMLNVARHLTPDVIMVSDLPDRGTAKAALEIAMDGSLVLAAMESCDSTSALTCLMDDMLLPTDLIAGGLVGIIAQRLVRKIDPLCKESHRPDHRLLIKYFGTADATYVQSLYHGKGCRLCDEGYRGRTGLFQILPVSAEIRTLIERHGAPAEMADAVTALGTGSLSEDGLEKVLNGITTLEELDRVLTNHHFSADLVSVA